LANSSSLKSGQIEESGALITADSLTKVEVIFSSILTLGGKKEKKRKNPIICVVYLQPSLSPRNVHRLSASSAQLKYII
jgi:hypothetical protein